MNQRWKLRKNKKIYNLPSNRELRMDMDKRQRIMAKATREAIRILIGNHKQEFKKLVEIKFMEKIKWKSK